jgi:hypothetical protein
MEIPGATTQRAAYTGGRFTLELDQKKPVGFVQSIDGGHFKAEAVSSFVGGVKGEKEGDFLVTRYPGKPKYEDITINIGTTMGPGFWDWVIATVNGKPQRRDGALVGYDFDNKERSRRTFQRALISEIGFPGLDAAGKSSAMLTVKISPERMTYADGDRSSLTYTEGKDQLSKQKKWLVSNFRFEIDRFKSDKLNISKIEAFAIKHNVITNHVGSEREARKEPGKVELPTLQLTFLEDHLEKWLKWYDTTVVKGNPEETTCGLTYLANDLRTELMRIEFAGAGLTSLEIEKYEAGKESLAKVKATLYMESITLKAGNGTV